MLNLKDRVLNKFKRTFTDIYKRETYSQMGEDLIMAKNKFYLFSLGRGTATGIHQLVQADCLFKKQG